MTETEIRTFEIYLINAGNFASMHDAAHNGDSIARRIWLAIKNYLTSGPSRECAFCEQHMFDEITFVIMLQGEESLTAVICEDCNDRNDDDINMRLETVIRRWMPDAEFSHITFSSTTRH